VLAKLFVTNFLQLFLPKMVSYTITPTNYRPVQKCLRAANALDYLAEAIMTKEMMFEMEKTSLQFYF